MSPSSGSIRRRRIGATRVAGMRAAAKPPSWTGRRFSPSARLFVRRRAHVRHREPRGVAGLVSDFDASRVAAPAGRCSRPTAASSGSPRSSDEKDQAGAAIPVVRIDDACEVVASAEKKMKDAAPPNGRILPVEPVRPFPVDALKDAAQRRAGSLNPYQMSSSDFDIAFITPVLAYGAQYQSEQAADASQQRRATPDAAAGARPPADGLRQLVRLRGGLSAGAAGPRDAEDGGELLDDGGPRRRADTGRALPPIKHFKSGFSRMRVFCGDAEVTPIHPFKLEQRVSESDAIYEGLYVFDPGALGPQCGTVKLVLYSEKEPEKGDTRVVDPKVVQQIWQDFTPYRAPQ